MIFLLFVCQVILQSIYCKYSYSTFKDSAYYPYSAMLSGMFSQLIWSQILGNAQNYTAITIDGVLYDSVTFLIWALFPLLFFGSFFSRTGIIGVILVVTGMLLVGFQNLVKI